MRRTATPRPLPFAVNHGIAKNLSDQVADGLRRAIASGFYRKGDVLPTLHDLAGALGTSLRVPREAVARLAAENLVSPRPRVGSVVLGPRETLWKGQLLAVVPADLEGTYHAATLLGEMRRRLAAAGYLFLVETLDRRKGGAFDFARLDLALQARFDFAFAFHCPHAVQRRIRRAGVPLVAKDGDAGLGTSAASFGDMAAFFRQCAAVGVGRALLVGYGHGDLLDALRSRMAAAGLEVETCPVKIRPGTGFLERLERSGMARLLDRFARPRETWPDLVFWADDYLAVGGLAALQERGVAIPRDVYAVALANKGLVPVYPRSLTRFEFDPAETGRVAAENILARMDGRDPGPIPDVVSYVAGESFPPA